MPSQAILPRRAPDLDVMRLKMLQLTVAVLLLTLVSGSKCPDQQLCGDEQTCCQTLTSGEYDCCPFHQGECCEDHTHCCPEGFLCQVTEAKCSNATHSVPWAERLPSHPKSFRMISSSVAGQWNSMCPDASSCPPEFSCLKLSDMYGCCPVEEGMACSDEKHCCPNNHKCSDDSTFCLKRTDSDVPCNDTAACPDGSTCCKTKDGQWACCPLEQAVCCEDFIHCCPHGKKCNVAAGTCEDASGSTPWLKKSPSQPIRAKKLPETKNYNVPCNDTAACPDGSTCCKTKDGQWACCPLEQAVCCEDFIHCCPHGKKCNVAAGTCEDASGSTPWLKKSPSQPIRAKKLPETKNSDVPCDDTAACPDGSTCCKTKDGQWACCPLEQAVCCEDFIHCCPHGKKCNVAAGTCEDASGSTPWLKKSPSQPIRSKKLPETKNSDVPCNDTAACPDGSTCCKTKDGQWACCPLEQAVCCEDFIHCCPHGKKCNVAAGTCEDASGSTPWLKKSPSQPIRTKKLPETKNYNVPCNDTAACPDGSTCCKTKDGQWACCPLEQAVCCEDFIHCCPHGKKCNVAAGTCEDASGSTPWLKKSPSQPIRAKKLPETKNSDVPCDDTAACPDGSTCCKTKDGQWACCPLEQAVCCEDFIHCCPHGKKCNVAAGTCEDASGSIPWMEKSPSQPIRAKKLPETKNSDVPCNDTAACPDGSTCCKTKDGQWACCPLEQAVCCEDFIHCCPHGKKCNVAAGTCEDASGSTPWLKKSPSQPIRAKKLPETKNSDVPCNDTAACPDGSTCCKTKDGQWACCPLEQAVCCEDFIHCCPHGKKCNVAAGTCEDASGSTPWLEKSPSHVILSTGRRSFANMSCDSGHSCPDSTTCCKHVDAHWSCCPLKEGVCCIDRFHCCPHDTSCNMKTLTCDSSTSSIPMTVLPPSKKDKDVKVEENDLNQCVQCDHHTSCPDHTTCCFMHQTHKWGCCPLADAVCCNGGEHCCPKDYSCQGDSCVKSDWLQVDSLPLTSNRVSATQQIQKDIQCGGGFSCHDDQTCCKISETSWGCCPLPKAVCCSDMVHCCPAGLSCGEGGTCVQGTGFGWNHWENFLRKKK